MQDNLSLSTREAFSRNPALVSSRLFHDSLKLTKFMWTVWFGFP